MASFLCSNGEFCSLEERVLESKDKKCLHKLQRTRTSIVCNGMIFFNAISKVRNSKITLSGRAPDS